MEYRVNPRNPKVSVIMACHNSAAYLEEAVSSVLRQAFRDLELILIDDGSTDRTAEIAEQFQSEDSRVFIIVLPVKSGVAAARNAGIQAARGRWLGILDSDDVAVPSRFEDQLELADRNHNLVLIGSNSISIDAEGNAIKEHGYPTDHETLVKRLYSMRAFMPHSSMMYRRDAVDKLKGFNAGYAQAEDHDLWLRLSEVGTFASIDRPLVKIRKHEKNMTNVEGGRQQLKYAHAGVICHFLRALGEPDPASILDEGVWQVFLDWTERRLIEEGVFDRRTAWADARSAFFSKKTKLTGALCFCSLILRSGHARAALVEKYRGSSVPMRLALEWVEESKSRY